jgi:hypothetical protein
VFTDLHEIGDMFAHLTVPRLERDTYLTFARKGAPDPEERRSGKPADERLARWAAIAAKRRADLAAGRVRSSR